MSVWIILIIILSSVFLGLAAFFKNPRNKTNRLFLLMIIFVVIWQLSNFFENENISPDLARLFLRVDFASAVFVGYFWLIFVLNFSKASNFIMKPLIKYAAFIASLALSLLSFTDLIISNVNFENGAIRFDNGCLWSIYALIVVSFFVSSYAILILNLLKSRGLERMQTLYIFVGFSTSSIIALIINLFLSNFLTINQARLGLYGIIVFIICTFYAIIRYRLMDIRIVARKIFIYFGIAIFTYGIYYLVTYFYDVFLGGAYSSSALTAGIFISLIFVISFQIIIRSLNKFANKYLFYSLYNYQTTINELAQKLNYLKDLDEIIDLIVDKIKQTMQLDRAGVLLINPNKKPDHFEIAKVVGFNEHNGIGLVKDNFLTRYLQKTQRPLVREELYLLARDAKNKREQKSFNRLNDHMSRIEASLCLPLMSSKSLIGIIVLGSKISNNAFTREDLDLLNTLAYQAGIAIDNARLYKEVQDFNKTLKQKVDEQTNDIKQKSKHLQELLNMKSEFLRVVNHQLNTPLSVMRNAFSMTQEKVLTPTQGIKIATRGLDKISQTIADFWDAYELEGERMKMNPEITDIAKIINKLIEEKKNLQLIQERKLKVLVKKPNFKIPLVWCDPKKITHVISNLLNNAVFYTLKGKITIFYELADKQLKVNIKDTGAGISEENKKRLFKKFSRGYGATELHPDGSGLGLYIAHKIVECNNGTISYFSAGQGQGSTFSFTIPIYTDQKSQPKAEDNKNCNNNLM